MAGPDIIIRLPFGPGGWLCLPGGAGMERPVRLSIGGFRNLHKPDLDNAWLELPDGNKVDLTEEQKEKIYQYAKDLANEQASGES